MPTRRTVLAMAAAAGGMAIGGGVAASYASFMREAEARVAAGSLTIASRFGTLEYAQAGSGRPVLAIHGTGGGFDQGLEFARRLVSAGYHVTAPSRFGYLRSDFPADPSSANQADAFIDLLDALGIDRLPVMGGSAGALPALEFAIRHPERCSALVAIVPATYAPERPSLAPMSGLRQYAMEAVLGSDFLFWAALELMPDMMIGTLLATDPGLVAAASPDERARVERILRNILPVSRRTRGLLNDARLTADPMPLERVGVPTLIISLIDDRFGTVDAARHMAARIEGSRLVVYPAGGHVWVGHDEELFATIDAFLKSLH